MACKHTSMRFIMMVINVVVLVAGLAVFGVGLCWYLKVTKIWNLFGDFSKYMSFALMIAGLASGIASVLGGVGAITQSLTFLVVYKILNIVLLIGKGATVVLVFIKKEWFLNSRARNEPDNVQLIFTAFMAAITALEITATVFSYNLMRHIKTCRAENE